MQFDMIVKFHLCPCKGLTSRPFEPTLLAMSGHMYISMQCVLFRSSQIAVSLYSSSMSNDRVDSDQRTRYRSLTKARSRIICRVYMTEWLAQWLLTARKMSNNPGGNGCWAQIKWISLCFMYIYILPFEHLYYVNLRFITMLQCLCLLNVIYAMCIVPILSNSRFPVFYLYLKQPCSERPAC